MRLHKIRQYVGFFSVMALFFTWVPLSEATEIKFLKVIYSKAQERMGTEIQGLGGLEFEKGQVQEELGGLIQKSGQEMKINQEALGSGIASTGHLQWKIMGANDRLAHEMARTAAIVVREESILGPGAIQERLGAMILANAQTQLVHNAEAIADDIYNAARHQEGLGRQIVKTAQLNWASGEMGKAVFATTQGRRMPEISGAVIRTVQSTGGFRHEGDFRLGLTALASERGKAFSELMPSKSPTVSESAVTYAGAGWGGFAEYGFASIVGFVFAMWLFGNSLTSLQPPDEKGEAFPYEEYRKAA